MNKFEIRNKYGERLETLIEGAPLEKASKVLVFIHGFGTDLHERGVFDHIVEKLSSNRHQAFVRFSWSGFGKSEGKQEDTTLMKISEDLESILDFVFNYKSKASDVVVISYSMGNIATAKTLANYVHRIKQFIAINPTGFETGNESFKRWVSYEGAELNDNILTIPRADGTITRLNRAFWDTMDDMNYRANLEKLVAVTPSIFIRATDDKIIDNSGLKEIKFQQIIELTGGHGFKEQKDRDRFLETMDDLFTTKYPVTDTADNLIEYKKKDDITHDDIYRVASLWIYNSKGQILLAKRAMGKRNNPGKWMPVAVSGTVEEQETYEQNVIKETYEELGIDLGAYKYSLIFSGLMNGNHKFHLHVFGACIDQPLEAFDFDHFETSEIRWFETEKLTNLVKESPELFTPNAGRIIPELLERTHQTH